MRFFITIFFTLISLNLYSQNQEMQQLLSMQSVPVSEVPDICSMTSCEPFQKESVDGLSLLHSTDKSEASLSIERASYLYDAYYVGINIVGGYTFHVADYLDGTRVVTCLDGSMRGCQGVAKYGVQIAASDVVVWHSNYFVHYYQDGEITSFPSAQVIEIY